MTRDPKFTRAGPGTDRKSPKKDSKANKGDVAQALINTAAISAAIGVAAVLGSRVRATKKASGSDAPRSTRRDSDKDGGALIGRTVTINKPRQELYAFWRDFTKQTQFAENIQSVDMLDDKRVRFVMKAPGGTTVTLVNRVVEDVPGQRIAWESEPDSAVRNSGRVEFVDAPPGRGTMVRVTISYDPPGGVIGKVIAKVLQREPNVQARRDLRRFKQLMETGEVTTSASPSGRKSENPSEQYL